MARFPREGEHVAGQALAVDNPAEIDGEVGEARQAAALHVQVP